MKAKGTVSILVFFIVVLSTAATIAGIFSSEGPGPFEYETIRGETVMIYGKGIYQHMSLEVAPQGIAQDVVTLFIGVPILLIALYLTRRGWLRGRILLAGTLGYFFVTYLLYMLMCMFNNFFLIYVILTSLSFFALSLTLFSFDLDMLRTCFNKGRAMKGVSGFLIFNATIMGLLWLGVVVPPLLNGSIPLQVEHYTTLVVQAVDLALLLPIAFVAGVLLLKDRLLGYLLVPVYMHFLALLMTALSAKIIGMSILGTEVGPAIIVIPIINLTAIFCVIVIWKNINERAWVKIR
ncbi:hypothetical protein P9E76_03680 [Schinkia azotoformans]|uniref:Uncharacterized protein n=1 Tax=Schinkia azotoformans LMG 9581 TaxID=1131731 RepID=K6DDD1_SCHAZ|nr:hypothetical protein [Schinkia azotoformans]EKN66053.1 hypothetical protein BAZO_11269 [Schinkia azotoformans LMG 9581]MEC1639804.1 hypothetical protein [Schinkia azotoformans]MEC1944169.1 hypothetical protein [Schinkia azotoformans]MED4354332.1 hypothetical protein [Schinkia azotoformans]